MSQALPVHPGLKASYYVPKYPIVTGIPRPPGPAYSSSLTRYSFIRSEEKTGTPRSPGPAQKRLIVNAESTPRLTRTSEFIVLNINTHR
jgi:hypothetical protein